MSEQDFQKQVLDRLDNLLIKLEKRVTKSNILSTKVDNNVKFIEYWKSTQSLVQLAFGLMVSATVIAIVSTIFKR